MEKKVHIDRFYGTKLARVSGTKFAGGFSLTYTIGT